LVARTSFTDSLMIYLLIWGWPAFDLALREGLRMYPRARQDKARGTWDSPPSVVVTTGSPFAFTLQPVHHGHVDISNNQIESAILRTLSASAPFPAQYLAQFEARLGLLLCSPQVW